VPVAIAMIAGGLTGGWLYRWQSQIARRPLTGFCLTFILLLLRDGLIFFWAPIRKPPGRRSNTSPDGSKSLYVRSDDG
jgi:hypothetical protein